jgi:hypothetical protein
MNRFAPINWIQWMTLLLLPLLAVLVTLVLLSIRHVQEHQNDGLHAVICFSENFVRSDKRLTPAQKVQDLRIYDRMLAVAHLPDCP